MNNSANKIFMHSNSNDPSTNTNKTYTFWFTGLSNSGKTSLTTELQKRFVEEGIYKIKILDGDEVRRRLNLSGYSESERAAVGDAKIKMCQELNDQGFTVFVSGIAHRLSWRMDARRKITNYYEIFLECSVEACTLRDTKGVYSRQKNVIGIDSDYEMGSHDLLVNTEKNNTTQSVDIVYNAIYRMIT
jgi:adenylylsulfate kinase-like enzyme